HDVVVLAAEPDGVGGEQRVAVVDVADRAGGHEQQRVEGELHPAPVAGALVHRPLAVRALPLLLGGALAVPLEERLADAELGGRPDLAVGVHLLADQVVGDVAVVQRRLGHVVVADAALGVSGDVSAGDVRGLARGAEPGLVQVLHREQVGCALVHGARLGAAPAGVRSGDHAAGDGVAVLVPDDGHVVVAVDAGRVERAGDRLPQVHVGDRGDPVGAGDLVGVVADGQVAGAGLGVALLGVAAEPAAVAVVLLHVPRGLGEAEFVGPVVHALMLHVQVGDGGLEVGLARLVEHGRIALGLEPGVAPRVPVVPVGGEHVAAGADRERVAAGAVLVRASGVAEAAVAGLACFVVHVPGVAGGRVAAGDVVAAALVPVAPGLPGVAGGVVGRRVG